MPILLSSFSISSLLVGDVSQCPFPLFVQLGGGRLRNLSWGHAKLCSEAQITTSDSVWSKTQLAVISPCESLCGVSISCPSYFSLHLFLQPGSSYPGRSSGTGCCSQPCLTIRAQGAAGRAGSGLQPEWGPWPPHLVPMGQEGVLHSF